MLNMTTQIRARPSSIDAPVEHGVEGSNFIDTHWWHFKELRDVVHDADTCPSFVLSLAEIEERNDSSFLVLWGIPGNDFFRLLQVIWGKLERYLGSKKFCTCILGRNANSAHLWVVILGVPMLVRRIEPRTTRVAEGTNHKKRI